MKEKLISLVTVASLLSACSLYHPRSDVDTTNLGQLQGVMAGTYTGGLSGAEIGQLRYKALEDTAMSLGAQGGLASASQQINVSLEKDRKHLDNIFNFNGMILSHGVLPPVLVQGNNSLNLDDPDTIRVADKTFKIVEQAHFVTTPPNWRDYLWLNYEKPELPNKVLLPKTKQEHAVWSRAIALGWDRGTQQAYSIFQQNLARLKRDYQGMILYRKLLQEKMINAPYVSKTELGVTGDGNDMRVNDQVLRITEHPQLQTESNNWRAIVVKKDDY
ncbi:MAG: type IV secretion system DotC family protein [Gammaproteobacteria bacterium]|nr:type IV secretion system DotC family protein [Gammaproteobacteria bacterium]